jgi:hypothetical protein
MAQQKQKKFGSQKKQKFKIKKKTMTKKIG